MSKLLLTLFAALLCLAVKSQDDPDIAKTTLSPEDSLSSRLQLSVNCRNRETLINWTAGHMQTGDFFIVEKSLDSLHFEILSAIGASTDSAYTITDNAIADAPVFYRLRITGSSGNRIWTSILRAQADMPVNLKFYPNPVDKQLLIRATHTLGIQVRDEYGTIWINREISPGLQTINVSTLQKGTYILQATDKQTNQTVSAQLIKA